MSFIDKVKNDNLFLVDIASGIRLDRIAALFDLSRLENEIDEAFRARIIKEIHPSSGEKNV